MSDLSDVSDFSSNISTLPVFHTPPPPPPSIDVRDMHFSYGDSCVLKSVNLAIPENRVTALIGPSGCGKSTLLRCFNRMNDEIPGARVTRGSIHIGGIDIHHRSVDVVKLRRDVGMIFQKSNPFPRSIHDNVAFGLHLRGSQNRDLIAESVESALRSAAL